MKVSVRNGRLTVDTDNTGLLVAAFDAAAESWLELAAASEATDARKNLLKMAGEAKALSLMISAKQEDEEPAT